MVGIISHSNDVSLSSLIFYVAQGNYSVQSGNGDADRSLFIIAIRDELIQYERRLPNNQWHKKGIGEIRSIISQNPLRFRHMSSVIVN